MSLVYNGITHMNICPPRDVIVADDDGVMVVPQEIADEVACRAMLIQDKDRPGRRENYKKPGLPLDETV